MVSVFAVKNFERFKTQGESFVAWYLALALNKDNDTFKKLWNLSKEHRETTWQGVVSAFAYLSPESLKKRIDILLSDDASAGLKALGLSLAAVRRVPIAE